jgi:hypothetical protein
MAKLIELQEAASMLGISPEELTEMRSRNEIFGYRDGASWKFKMAEIERVAEEKGLTLGSGDASDESDDLVEVSLDEDVGGDSDSILVSDEELGQSDDTTASTIIGEADDLVPSGESDLQIDGGSELRLVSDSESGISDDIELSVGSDDVLTGDEEQEPGPSDTANLASPSSSEIGDELSLSSDSGSLELSLDDLSDSGSELRLGDSQSAASGASGFGSAIDLDLDDDDLVLGSGSSGSDITSGAGDSGINLANPSDSGLSLEEPIDLAEGSGGELLELGEDDMIEVQDDASGEELSSEDDFLLTPVEDGMEEEADSGSQVIALDTEEFDDSAAQMLTDVDQGLEEETIEFTDADAPAALAPAAAAAVSGESQEAPYTIWNVLSLFFIVVFLGFTGILMLDLMNNIWSWQGNYSFNSKIMDGILSMLPGSQ